MKTKKPVKANKSKSRCEGPCLRLFKQSELTAYPDTTDLLCEDCTARRLRLEWLSESDTPEVAKADRAWYAIWVSGSNTRAQKNIRAAVRRENIRGAVGKFLTPKENVGTVTKNRYEVLGPGGRLIGHVTAGDQEEAEHLAEDRYGPPRTMKGVYKPDTNLDVFEKLEKCMQSKRVAYRALSDTGRVMGVLTGHKGPKQAEAAARKLYGPRVENTDPRAGNLVGRTTVTAVNLVKAGGAGVKSRRLIDGYMLVELKDDPRVFAALKTVSGVSAVLPYTEKPTRNEEKLMREGILDRPVPTSIPQDQIDPLLPVVLKPVELDYTTGDLVEVVAGPYTGQKCVVQKIGGAEDSPTIWLNVGIMGRPVAIAVSHASIRRA